LPLRRRETKGTVRSERERIKSLMEGGKSVGKERRASCRDPQKKNKGKTKNSKGSIP